MIKALLIVAALAGGGDYTTEMPSMQSCLDARLEIMRQDPDLKTLCIPKGDETTKMKEFFKIFMDMIDRMREKEQEEYSKCPCGEDKSPWINPLNTK